MCLHAKPYCPLTSSMMMFRLTNCDIFSLVASSTPPSLSRMWPCIATHSHQPAHVCRSVTFKRSTVSQMPSVYLVYLPSVESITQQ